MNLMKQYNEYLSAIDSLENWITVFAALVVAAFLILMWSIIYLFSNPKSKKFAIPAIVFSLMIISLPFFSPEGSASLPLIPEGTRTAPEKNYNDISESLKSSIMNDYKVDDVNIVPALSGSDYMDFRRINVWGTWSYDGAEKGLKEMNKAVVRIGDDKIYTYYIDVDPEGDKVTLLRDDKANSPDPSSLKK